MLNLQGVAYDRSCAHSQHCCFKFHLGNGDLLLWSSLCPGESHCDADMSIGVFCPYIGHVCCHMLVGIHKGVQLQLRITAVLMWIFEAAACLNLAQFRQFSEPTSPLAVVLRWQKLVPTNCSHAQLLEGHSCSNSEG